MLRQRAAQLAAESAALRRDRDGTLQELAQAGQQLAALPPPRADDPNLSPARRAEIQVWLVRVKRMRQLFADRPDQRIPEMQLLTDEDWLRVAKRSSLESDDETRKALAEIRATAMGRFTDKLRSALQKYFKAANGEMPATILALALYFDPPVDSAMLERYEATKGEAPMDPRRSGWIVQNKVATDPDYESRYRLDASGGTSVGSGPTSWIPNFREQTQRAYKAYAETNKGLAPAGLADVLPFFNPPLDPALAEKLIKQEREYRK